MGGLVPGAHKEPPLQEGETPMASTTWSFVLAHNLPPTNQLSYLCRLFGVILTDCLMAVGLHWLLKSFVRISEKAVGRRCMIALFCLLWFLKRREICSCVIVLLCIELLHWNKNLKRSDFEMFPIYNLYMPFFLYVGTTFYCALSWNSSMIKVRLMM